MKWGYSGVFFTGLFDKNDNLWKAEEVVSGTESSAQEMLAVMLMEGSAVLTHYFRDSDCSALFSSLLFPYCGMYRNHQAPPGIRLGDV